MGNRTKSNAVSADLAEADVVYGQWTGTSLKSSNMVLFVVVVLPEINLPGAVCNLVVIIEKHISGCSRKRRHSTAKDDETV